MTAPATEPSVCDTLRALGQWNSDWDAMATLDPAWTEQFMRMVAMPLNSGVLDPKTFELIAIAVDASVTHMFAPGVQRHIRRALDIGVTPEEIMAVLQLTASLGLHTMSLASPMLLQELQRRKDTAAAAAA